MNPHSLSALLTSLGCSGIELATHPSNPERLRHRPSQLPGDLAHNLHEHRAAILSLLVNDYCPDSESQAGYVFAERLGVD